VGHNLQDHIGLGGFAFHVNQDVSLVQQRYENVPSVLKYAMFGDGPLTVMGGVEGTNTSQFRNIITTSTTLL